MRILFIDDHPEFVEEMSAQLTKHGHSVKCCLAADDAVKDLDNLSEYDVVILDIMMRLGSIIDENEASETGIAIYKRLRKINRNIPVVVISAMSKDQFWIKNGFAKDNYVMYYAKPLGADERIYQIIEKVNP
jgi:CheY-like chemotaxis protein